MGAFLLLAALPAAPQPATAQAWIGEYVGRMIAQERQYQCLMGVPLSGEEVAEAFVPAQASMRAYWRAVHDREWADVSTLFHPSRKARWMSGDTALTVAAGVLINDTHARTAAGMDAEPVAFVRAGSGDGTARGLWRLRAASGERAGAYLADFARRRGVWKLVLLRVHGPGEDPSAVTQYCQTPGDVEAYRARMAAIEADRAERRARKARKKGAPRGRLGGKAALDFGFSRRVCSVANRIFHLPRFCTGQAEFKISHSIS